MPENGSGLEEILRQGDVVRRLRLHAERNHRSLQGELMAIIETTAAEPGLSPQTSA